MEKKYLSFEKEEEEVKCNDNGTSFLVCTEEEKSRAV